jgi:phosphoadenosine phosphosulfate reductase
MDFSIVRAMPTSPSLPALNTLFEPLHPVERLQRLYRYFSPEEVLLTSSFGTQSALLLYWVSNLVPQQKVHFLDTGYHFAETLAYKEQLTAAFDLKVVELRADELEQQRTREQKLWQSVPERCCAVNKVQPLQRIQAGYKIWISGLMAYQSPQRQQLRLLEQREQLVKFYPLLDYSKGAFETTWKAAELPRHPLEALGYASVGCWPCTARGEGRSGRWKGLEKTECGLHFKQ